jgi:multidrug efflux pump subunit AcrA (membrane-fusion protein)
MDIVRAPRARWRRYVIPSGVFLALVATSVALAKIDPALATVEAASVVVDVVKRGDMERTVNATGILVPDHVIIVAALTNGRVDALPVRPGVLRS